MKLSWKWEEILRENRILLVGALIAASVIAVFTTFSAFLLHHRTGEDSYRIIAVFPQGGGINRGSKVLLNGVSVGSIEEIRLDVSGRVVMQLSILQRHMHLIRQNSVCYPMRVENLVSDRVLNIEQGDPRLPPLKDGDTVHTARSRDIEAAIYTLNNLADQAQQTLDRLNLVLVRLADSSSTIGKLMTSPELYDATVSTLEEAQLASRAGRQVLGRMDRVAGLMEQDLPGLMQRVDSTTQSIQASAQRADTLMTLAVGIGREGRELVERANDLAADAELQIDRVDRLSTAASRLWFLRSKLEPAASSRDRLPVGPAP